MWVAVEEGTEQACLTAYKATLVEKGYTLSEGGGLYYSPNHQIRVMVYVNEPGTFSIEFYAGPFLQWPAARLARLISEMLHTNVTDTLPAFNDGVEYSFDLYDEGLYLCIELDEDDDVADAVEAYSALLLREGFSEAGEDSDGDMHYLSPLKQFDVCPYEDDDFYIFIPNTAEELEWPLETINNYLSVKGWKDPLPEYEGNYTAIEASVDALGMFYVDITLDNPLVAVAEYCKLLKDEGWDLYEDDKVGGSTYISPSKEYSAWVCPHTGGFAITLDEAPKDPVTGAEFPMDEILACFPDAAGLVPTINNATSFESYGVEGYCDFEAYFEDEQTAAKEYTDYVAALVELGYSVETFYGNIKKYVAPNGKYYIAVYDESEEYNAIYVEFYTNN